VSPPLTTLLEVESRVSPPRAAAATDVRRLGGGGAWTPPLDSRSVVYGASFQCRCKFDGLELPPFCFEHKQLNVERFVLNGINVGCYFLKPVGGVALVILFVSCYIFVPNTLTLNAHGRCLYWRRLKKGCVNDLSLWL